MQLSNAPSPRASAWVVGWECGSGGSGMTVRYLDAHAKRCCNSTVKLARESESQRVGDPR